MVAPLLIGAAGALLIGAAGALLIGAAGAKTGGAGERMGGRLWRRPLHEPDPRRAAFACLPPLLNRASFLAPILRPAGMPPLAVLSASLLLLLLILLLVLPARRAPARARLCSGPHNIGLYDAPYEHYPRYEGRGATWWDGPRRCMASCSQSPCTVWCR